MISQTCGRHILAIEQPLPEVPLAVQSDPSRSAGALDLFRLDGRVAIVTGGGGALGSAMASGLASAGAKIVIADQNLEAAEAAVGRITAAGGEAFAVQGDVTEQATAEATVQRALERWDRLDILINSAGLGARGAAAEYERERWDHVLNVNLTGTFLFCQAAGRAMLERGSGSIVNIASIAGLIGYAGNPAYLASKGGVVQVTRALAVEWATRGVRVNAIAPGVIASPLVEKQVEREPEFYVAFRERHPVSRFGTPDELVGPALFLCSDASSFVTGHILAVDGGYTAA
jgi:NAD(P)-dependent dehydrogenase (short-subunit alcohol dehydrogenase family)